MSYIVKSKSIDNKLITPEHISKKSIGRFYSNDRYYTLINDYIDKNLVFVSRPLAAVIKYLFRSSNYKHDPQIANGRSIWILLFDIWCAICVIGFLAMLIAILGTTFAEAAKLATGNVSIFTELGQAFVNKISANVPMLVFGVIFLIFAILWFVVWFFIRRKNKPLSLQAYVEKKIGFILMFRSIVKTIWKSKKVAGKKINKMPKVQIVYLENFEAQGGEAPRWLNLQLINLLVSIFEDFSLIFKFDTLTDDEYNFMNKVSTEDFKRIEIIKVED